MSLVLDSGPHTMIDMTTACRRTAALLGPIRDDQLDAATPCERFPLADVVAHVGLLGLAFAAAARKDLGDLTDTPPEGDFVLDDDWRDRYPANLLELAAAWREPAAWEGMTRIAGMDMPGETVAMIALGEVTIHGWDIAVATGQDYAVDDDEARAVLEYVESFAADGPVDGLFGPAVPVAADASTFDRALAASGRDPRMRAN
ncbi:TIGR03086 family protein [Mycolicibacterium arabiense]|uniref:TIGR03086 family protein n=2 Tax=Mycolicibacterium arabiense TaxID=1286181 RepID=A0A7I7S3C4_9MYCO|nr:TIGR03086 family protein [Mycolicibacterium arabiense]